MSVAQRLWSLGTGWSAVRSVATVRAQDTWMVQLALDIPGCSVPSLQHWSLYPLFWPVPQATGLASLFNPVTSVPSQHREAAMGCGCVSFAGRGWLK